MAARFLLSGLLLWQTLTVLIAQTGNVGINTTTPSAPLHVIRTAPAPGSKLTHVIAILEDNEESFIQLSHPENMATGILSGDRWTPIRSSLIFAGDSSILFKSGGDISRMIINKKGRVGINSLAPLAQLHVQDSSVLFSGNFPLPAFPSEPPVNGLGVRMMWYPDKGAFRSGAVLAQRWSKENTGNFSAAIGYDVMAKGFASTALGANTMATGEAATVLGYGGVAKGDYSFAQNWTIAKSYASFVIGSHNDTTSTSSTEWNWNDPLFIIGNGSGYSARNNALTVLKNAKTGINTPNPQSMLHVVRNGTSAGPYAVNAIATFESNSSSWIHLKHPNTAQAAILSGNEETNVRSGLLFDADSSLHFRSGGNFTRMKLNKSGYLGINTTTPQSLLHIRKSGASGGPVHGYALATLESNVNGYLQFSQTTNTEAGILSGNALTDIRSALIFAADSSMRMRTGGNLTRLTIDKNGKTGIGTSNPKAQLHVKDESVSGADYSNAAMAIFERNADSYIQLITPAGTANGIISSDPVSLTRSGLYFLGDGSVAIHSGSNGAPRILVNETGNVGIGTADPAAKLDVNGNFILGASGTPLTKVLQDTPFMDLPSIAAGTSYIATFSIPGISAGGNALVSPVSNLPDGLIIAYTQVGIGSVLVKFTNVTSGSINAAVMQYVITVIQ